ncbi:unnamed protein product [Paramecium pentaurelia]|uniref:Uncharacterized protein n=1 Tax=Paramecium pentaurelia TaxID=43138 RepID=A0A8S1Y0T3_9CILI|nr:unnamed protein product [Paramecium pentaurelia]
MPFKALSLKFQTNLLIARQYILKLFYHNYFGNISRNSQGCIKSSFTKLKITSYINQSVSYSINLKN